MSQLEAIAQLEAQLRMAPPNVGVKLGEDLFDELCRQNKITKAELSVAGTGAFPELLNVVGGSHPVYKDASLDPLEFRVGEAENQE